MFVLVLFIKIIIYRAEEQSKTKGPLCSSLDEPRALLVRSRMKHQHKKMQNKAAGAMTTRIYPLQKETKTYFAWLCSFLP